MIAIDLSIKQTLDAGPKAIQETNFIGNPNRAQNVNVNTAMFFIIEEVKETTLDFSQENVEELSIYFTLM